MKKNLLLLAVVLIGLALFFIFKQKSPEEQIKAQLHSIDQKINTHEPNTNPIQAMKIANELAEFVSNDIILQHQTQDIKYDFIHEKKELTYSLAMAQRMYDKVEVERLETQITVLTEHEASAEAVYRVRVFKSDSEAFNDVIPIKLYLSKIDDTWKITKAYNIDPFE